MIADLNPILRGWGAYFRTGNAARSFNQIDTYVYERLKALRVRPALLLALALVAATACRDGDAPKPGSVESARWVDQFVASDNGEPVRVIGTITEPITTADQTKNVMFWLAHGGARLRVVYRGTLPDRVRVGWEAAAVGRWRTGDDAQRALADHGFGSAEAGGVFVAADLAAYVPRF